MKRMFGMALAMAAGAASGQVVDGLNFAAEYGPAVFSQTIGTGFGNSTDGQPVNANGSELDSVFGRIVGTTLFLGIGGNLQNSFNPLVIALDFTAGGQNTLAGTGFSGGALDGLTFDAGFESDLVLSFNLGDVGGGNQQQFLDASVGAGGLFIGGSAAGTLLTGSINGAPISININNSNALGVNSLGSPFDSDPSTVVSGVELAIDLAALGYTGGAINVAGFINGSGNNFLSNQVIGGLPAGTGNLGGNGSGGFIGNVSGINFNNFAGNQFVTIVPAPGTLALLGLGGLAAGRRRR